MRSSRTAVVCGLGACSLSVAAFSPVMAQEPAKPAAAQPAAVPATAAAPAAKPARRVTVTTLTAGEGAKPAAQDIVLISYKGTLPDGTVFDQNDHAVMPLDEVVPGFAQGLVQMQRGGTYRMVIPSELAYGDKASGPIPANTDLTFEVSLLDFKTPQEFQAMIAQMQAAAAEREKDAAGNAAATSPASPPAATPDAQPTAKPRA